MNNYLNYIVPLTTTDLSTHPTDGTKPEWVTKSQRAIKKDFLIDGIISLALICITVAVAVIFNWWLLALLAFVALRVGFNIKYYKEAVQKIDHLQKICNKLAEINSATPKSKDKISNTLIEFLTEKSERLSSCRDCKTLAGILQAHPDLKELLDSKRQDYINSDLFEVARQLYEAEEDSERDFKRSEAALEAYKQYKNYTETIKRLQLMPEDRWCRSVAVDLYRQLTQQYQQGLHRLVTLKLIKPLPQLSLSCPGEDSSTERGLPSRGPGFSATS